MNPEDVGRVLDEIGERIGPAGEYAWQLAVRQIAIEGALALVGGILFMGIGALVIWLGYRHDQRIEARRKDGSYSYDTKYDGVQLMLGGPLFVGGLVLLGVFGSMILNPEYHAMIRLLDRLVPQ